MTSLHDDLGALRLSESRAKALRARIGGRLGQAPASLPSTVQLGLERIAPVVSLAAVVTMLVATAMAGTGADRSSIDARTLYTVMRGAP